MRGISKQIIISLLLGVGIGLLLGYVFFTDFTLSRGESTQIRGGGRKFTNPLLACEIAQGRINSQKLNFSTELNAEVDSLIHQHSLNSVGVYFRDLNNGPTFGLHQDDGYLPASLLKLPVAITLYKMQEEGTLLLDQEILFASTFSAPQDGDKQYLVPSDEIKVGERYTVSELIRRSLVYSDNQAIALLYEKLNKTNPQALRNVYRLLGVSENVLNGPNATLSVKQYSAFLRILYDSSYLDDADSEKLLEMLSVSEFKNGLVAGVPNNIVVAHKFGESGLPSGVRELHDCGIIYYPKHPYLLCIMSQGDTLDTLFKSISEISRFVFGQIDAQYKNEVTE